MRTREERGLLVAILGPDGSGKSSVIDALGNAGTPNGEEVRTMHFRPALGRRRRNGARVAEPHARPLRGWWTSVVKLLYYLADYRLGYLLKVRPELARGRWVIFDRYYHDLLVDPRRYRYGGPRALARLVARLVPTPDVSVLLDADTVVLRGRKPEVPERRLERIRSRYRSLVVGLPGGRVVDASRPLTEVVGEVEGILREEARSGSRTPGAAGHPRSSAHPRSDGHPREEDGGRLRERGMGGESVGLRRGQPAPRRRDQHVGFPPGSRFLMLPRRPARATRAGLALYEAAEPKQRIAAWAGRSLATLRLAGLLPKADRPEVDWEWWTGYVDRVVEPAVGPVGHLAFRVPGTPRVSALAMDRSGRPLAFGKILNGPVAGLPAAASEALTARPTTAFRVPGRLAEGSFQGRFHRLLEPLPEGLHRPPPFDPERVWSIVDEFHERLRTLPRPEGVPAGYTVCHTEFTPRNLRVASDGGWWLFDWDSVRWGPRLADEVRYWCASFAYRFRPRVERDAGRVLALLRQRGPDDEIREALEWPDRIHRMYRSIENQIHAAVGRLLGDA